MRHLISPGRNTWLFFRISSISDLRSCVTKSMTIKILSILEPTTISRTVTTLGCCEMSSVLISRKEVMGKPSFSRSILSRFRATIS